MENGGCSQQEAGSLTCANPHSPANELNRAEHEDWDASCVFSRIRHGNMSICITLRIQMEHGEENFEVVSGVPMDVLTLFHWIPLKLS